MYVQTFKLSGQQISEPPLQQGGDAPHEEQPHPPTRGPEATTWTLAHRTLKTQTRLKLKCDCGKIFIHKTASP